MLRLYCVHSIVLHRHRRNKYNAMPFASLLHMSAAAVEFIVLRNIFLHFKHTHTAMDAAHSSSLDLRWHINASWEFSEHRIKNIQSENEIMLREMEVSSNELWFEIASSVSCCQWLTFPSTPKHTAHLDWIRWVWFDRIFFLASKQKIQNKTILKCWLARCASTNDTGVHSIPGAERTY